VSSTDPAGAEPGGAGRRCRRRGEPSGSPFRLRTLGVPVIAALAAVLPVAVTSGSAGGPAVSEAPPGDTGSREPVRYVAIGGGAAPESTEISLEQDVVLARTVLRPPGLVLFGGGPSALSVRLEDWTDANETLLTRLGDLFHPRVGRRSRYRSSALPAESATLPSVNAALARALSHGDTPLLLYVATHGEKGETRRAGRVVLWEGETLTVAALGALHEAHPRPLRLVVAGCFSGGFAELAFRGTDVALGATVAPRCGLFAGTWDRETSGCDPNPDRRVQEGYSLHFLQALGKRDRRGATLPGKAVDIDGDGQVSLLEAHARARVASQSIDVPTTTSERYLRVVEQGEGAVRPGLLPEEAAVVRALSDRLSLGDREAAQRRWKDLDERLARADAELRAAEGELEQRYAVLATRLLSRWPVLDDPYHPDFAGMLARDAEAIDAMLDGAPAAGRYRQAQRAVDVLDTGFWNLQVEEALVMRLVRAHDTLARAAALRERGGDEWAAYQRLLACERWVPELQRR
jgi:hypothetical protein